jgi:hypothetical protein
MVKKPINSKIVNSEINQRIEKYRDPSINADGSVDCRKNITPVTERVRVLKPVSRKADGQYTRETSYQPKFKLVIYPYDERHIYRRDLKTGLEVAIVEKVDGEWFPCVILRETEIQQLRSFPGAAGLDIDNAIATKDRCKVKVQEPMSKNVGGRCTPKGKSKKGYSKPRTNNKFKKMMSSIEVHNAHKKGK